ncbi:hypothetical protein AAC387_Pa07g1145 [Persea americana]
MAQTPDLQNPDTHLLHELQSLSQSLHPSDPTRCRTASLSLPRSTPQTSDPRSRSRRMSLSLSPWRPRPKFPDSDEDLGKTPDRKLYAVTASTAPEKKGIWNWKPIRALTHLGMQRFSCLFSVEVESVRNLPASMNGLRLSVCVQKKETKGGAVSTMPARVLHGAADFEETLFLRCHVYCSASKQRLRFEPRPFLIYVVAVDAADELDFGRSSADLSCLVQESMEKNSKGTRIRQWDTNFQLSGKAKGGELVLKLGFQIMEDKGVGGIFSSKPMKGIDSSASDSKPFARKQSKSSFSIPSPKISKRFDFDTSTATKKLEGIDYLNLDEPRSVQKSDPYAKMKMEDLDLPEFEIVEKGIEIQDRERTGEADSEVSSEIVKEIVHDPIHLRRISELDSIAKQIKALQSMIGNEDLKEDADFHVLDAEEETVTKEFLQMLEEEEEDEDCKPDIADVSSLKLNGEEAEGVESKAFLSDLAKGLGPVIQTRDGGYLAAINPFQIEVLRRETPKLAMQISKPLILPSQKSASGFEFFQKLAAIGVEELASEVLSAASMDELIGKTAEQMAFEGIAAAIIHGRNKEGASSSVSRSIAVVKSMATAMNAGRKERISTGIWSVSEETVRVEEVLALSLQKIEVMAIEGLKIQAEMGEEEAPFDLSPLMVDGKDPGPLLASAVSLDEWLKNGGFDAEERIVTLVVVVQLRDPLRSFEAVGGPLIAVIQTNAIANGEGEGEGEEVRFKVGSLHVGGLKVRDVGLRRETWDEEKQRLTAMQWLVANGLGKGAKKGKNVRMKGQDCLWSISSWVMADMWLKPTRNPDVKFPKQI